MQLEIVMSTPGVLEVVVENIFLDIVVVIIVSICHTFIYFFCVIKFETGSTTVAARLSYKNTGSNYFLCCLSV